MFHYTPLGQLKQYQLSRRRRSEPISAHLWAEIGSKNLLPAPRTHRRGKRTYAKDCGVCSSLFQKSWNKIFPRLPAVLRDSLNLVPTPFFRIGTGFFRVYLRFCAFVPIVPVFNKSYIYKYMYRPLPVFLFSRFRFENNWNKWNIH